MISSKWYVNTRATQHDLLLSFDAFVTAADANSAKRYLLWHGPVRRWYLEK